MKQLRFTQKGQSLVELMISVAIGAIIALGVSSVFIFAIEQFTIMTEINKAQENLLLAAFHTKNMLSQGVIMRGIAPSADPNTTPDILANVNPYYGQILTSYTPRSQGIARTLAIFAREDGSGASTLKPTGIFYYPPTATAGATDAASGRILFAIPAPPGGGGSVVIDPNDLGQSVWFDGIVDFSIQSVSLSTSPTAQYSNLAEKAVIHIISRAFRDSNKTNWFYNVPSDTTKGTPTVAFKDYDMTVEVGFRNNLLNYNQTLPNGSPAPQQYLYGGVYFFKFINPVATP